MSDTSLEVSDTALAVGLPPPAEMGTGHLWNVVQWTFSWRAFWEHGTRSLCLLSCAKSRRLDSNSNLVTCSLTAGCILALSIQKKFTLQASNNFQLYQCPWNRLFPKLACVHSQDHIAIQNIPHISILGSLTQEGSNLLPACSWPLVICPLCKSKHEAQWWWTLLIWFSLVRPPGVKGWWCINWLVATNWCSITWLTFLIGLGPCALHLVGYVGRACSSM